MGLIIGQVIGDVGCIGELCHCIDASTMWQPLDCAGEGFACFKKNYLCNCDNVSVKVVRNGHNPSVVEGRALRMRLAMPRGNIRNRDTGRSTG